MGPGVAVIVNGVPYIVDAGEGIWRAMGREMANLPTMEGQRGVPASKVSGFDLKRYPWKNVFLTHLHSDHTIGLPSLILMPWSWGRADAPHIHGPMGTQNLITKLLEAYREDIAARVYGTEATNDTGWRAVPHEIAGSGEVFRDENVRVIAFRTHHGTIPGTYGYRFETPDRVVVVTGDTGYCEQRYKDTSCRQEILEYAKDADLLLHEVFGIDDIDNQPYDLSRAGEYHTSTKKLAEVANILKPKTLVLYHQQNYTRNPDQLVKEMKRYGYSGKVVDGRDRDVF